MKGNVYGLLVGFSMFCLCFTGCSNSSKPKNIDNTGFIIIKESESIGEKTIELKDLLDDFSIIKFENSDSAIFKAWKPVVSENYVAVIQGGFLPVVLFDKQGKFLRNIGRTGQGPGEYSMAFDVLIDEKRNLIYIAEMSTRHILKYDLEGNYLDTIEVGTLNKPSLFLNDDGTVSVVSISFADTDDHFTSAVIADTIIQKFTYPYLVTNLRDRSGMVNGFDNETWSFRNTDNNTFMMTFNDTLYSFNPIENVIKPRSFIIEKSQKSPESWYVGLELPDAIVYNIMGPDRRTIWYDKGSGEISNMKILNNYIGNASISTGNFRDGYFIQIWDPAQLIENIQERWFPDNKMTDQQRDNLNKLLSELDPDGNNIMFIGTLREY